MFSNEVRNSINTFIVSSNVMGLFEIISSFSDSDTACRRVFNMIAANQTISRDEKIEIRNQIKVLFRATFGDRIFFVDSPMHRKQLRRRYA